MNFKRQISLLFLLICLSVLSCAPKQKSFCYTGAFFADFPDKSGIDNFKKYFGKKPYVVLIFIDWGKFVDTKVIEDVYGDDCVLMVTLEPWNSQTKEGINFSELLSGKYDAYLTDLSRQLKNIGKSVYLRFAHEVNGNWYPWSGEKIGSRAYIAAYQYLHKILLDNQAGNVKFVFSINCEDVPKSNYFMQYYPGDEYVDYIGLDGYNWGNTQSWSKWRSFKEIFSSAYDEVTKKLKKPVMITEFSSTSSGGDKAFWIKEALGAIKTMKNIKGFVIFDYNKETDWAFTGDSAAGKELKRQLKDGYFKEKD